MLRRVSFAAGLWVGFGVGSVFGQSGCPTHQICPNPVSATDISNQLFGSVWLDTYSNSWTLTSSSGTVSGSVVVHNPASSSCPNVTFTVSGSMSPSYPVDGHQGYTKFSLYSSNPSPGSTCAGWAPVAFSYSGTIQNDGNDLAPNTVWGNAGGGGGTTTMTKSPSDIPVSETTVPVGFGPGVYATVAQFRPILNAASGSSDIFQGRQVSEYTGSGTNYDNCYFAGSAIPKFLIAGSECNVGYYAVNPPYVISANTWVDDYIGWTTVGVNYYRNHLTPGSFPCGARATQAMYIGTSGTSGGSQNYAVDVLGADIYTDHVNDIRAGITQTVYY